MTPHSEKPDFVAASPLNRDRQTRAHLCLTRQDRLERARLRRLANLEATVHRCTRELKLAHGTDWQAHPCPTCGTVIKTIDDFAGGS